MSRPEVPDEYSAAAGHAEAIMKKLQRAAKAGENGVAPARIRRACRLTPYQYRAGVNFILMRRQQGYARPFVHLIVHGEHRRKFAERREETLLHELTMARGNLTTLHGRRNRLEAELEARGPSAELDRQIVDLTGQIRGTTRTVKSAEAALKQAGIIA